MGRPPKHGIEVRRALSREYHALKSAGKLPDGWVEQKAKELGMHVQSVYRYIEETRAAEVASAMRSGVRARFDHSRLLRGGSR